MAKVDMKKVADGVFEKYPNQNTVFITGDGQTFLKKCLAKITPRSKAGDKEVRT